MRDTDSVYEELSAPFDHLFTDTRGGVELTYATGEQVISRLNEVLGVTGWNFHVREHGINEQADEVWVLGDLTVTLDGVTVIKSQFGSQKLKRRRQPNSDGLREILDIGFDLKGGTTDALKKCATLIGVALYLTRKEESAAPAEREHAPKPQANSTANHPAPANGQQHQANGDALLCAQCAAPLTETRFKDDTVWTPAQLAGYGRRKHSRTLCMTHYREANDARKQAEANASQDAPF